MTSARAHEHTKMSEHIIPWKTYLWIWLTLMGLMALTAYLSTVDLGAWNTPVALIIAVIKAVLVVLFFMHVKYSSKLTKLTICSGLFIFAGLVSMTLADYISRAWGRW